MIVEYFRSGLVRCPGFKSKCMNVWTAGVHTLGMSY